MRKYHNIKRKKDICKIITLLVIGACFNLSFPQVIIADHDIKIYVKPLTKIHLITKKKVSARVQITTESNEHHHFIYSVYGME